jgi:molybdopterin/thiamine biosynthesis adenylyltransferase
MLMVGFPISENFGDAPTRIHWFSIHLNAPKKFTGFRPDSLAYRKQQVKLMIHSDQKVNWLLSENWAKDQITSRGKIGESLATLNIAVIGAGAIGSTVSELLARLNCSKMTLIDNDYYNIGNSSRHILTTGQVQFDKAEAVAERLNRVFPFMNVAFEKATIESCLRKNKDYLDQFDLVIDATASEAVIYLISDVLKCKGTAFVSLSTSIEAKRLYCYMTKPGHADISGNFKRLITPWYVKQIEENPNPVHSMEGIGCWHPIFPARLDDILSILSPSLRQIEAFLISAKNESLVIVEKNVEGGC